MKRYYETEDKYGRSSVKEGLLLKLKLLRTARSTSKEGMIPVDTLGVLYLLTEDGVEFGCGSGFDDAKR